MGAFRLNHSYFFDGHNYYDKQLVGIGFDAATHGHLSGQMIYGYVYSYDDIVILLIYCY